MSKQRKGKFVADEGANRRYVQIGREEGWEVITIPPSLKSIGMPDSVLTAKFTQGRHPIFTTDKLAYQGFTVLTNDNPPQAAPFQRAR